ncbi:MAG: tRNA (adenosine(37)-N6)-threonylcarbamoyltransferase complex dimerization subunit type 1 TsaB [Anaerolineae bacterium]
MILALDTSTRTAGIAIYGGEEGVVSELTWRSSSHHTVELAPYLDLLLGPKELTGIAVALGPGSFTGLRVGLSLAKGFALAQGIPLIGIPTLDALAYSQSHQPLPICALLEAGRGRICAALYEKVTLHRVTDYLLTTLEGLSSEITRPTLICGEIDEVGAAILRKRLGDRAVVTSPAASLRRAGYLAELGWERLQRGEVDDPRTLEPLYSHRPEIPYVKYPEGKDGV